MNANRLVNMILRRLLRLGLNKLSKGQKPDPNTRRAAQATRSLNRIRKL